MKNLLILLLLLFSTACSTQRAAHRNVVRKQRKIEALLQKHPDLVDSVNTVTVMDSVVLPSVRDSLVFTVFTDTVTFNKVLVTYVQKSAARPSLDPVKESLRMKELNQLRRKLHQGAYLDTVLFYQDSLITIRTKFWAGVGTFDYTLAPRVVKYLSSTTKVLNLTAKPKEPLESPWQHWQFYVSLLVNVLLLVGVVYLVLRRILV